MLDEKKYVLKKICIYDNMIMLSWDVHAFGILAILSTVAGCCHITCLDLFFKIKDSYPELVPILLKAGTSTYFVSLISSLSISKYAKYKRNYTLRKASLEGIVVTEEDIRDYKSKRINR